MDKNKCQLYIPEKVCVGFLDGRKDTIDGKMAYITAYEKGKLRKEKSFNQWRNQGIPTVDLENKPSGGFIINQKITRHSRWSYGSSDKVRVYDTENKHEFEISTINFLEILETCDLNRKCLSGEYVYSWNGADLILLPTNSEEYKNSVLFTELRSKKVSAKDMVLFGLYETKKQEKLVYMGKHECNGKIVLHKNSESAFQNSYSKNEYTYWFSDKTRKPDENDFLAGYCKKEKMKRDRYHVFLDMDDKFIFKTDLTSIGAFLDNSENIEELSKKYADFKASKFAQKIKSIKVGRFSELEKDLAVCAENNYRFERDKINSGTDYWDNRKKFLLYEKRIFKKNPVTGFIENYTINELTKTREGGRFKIGLTKNGAYSLDENVLSVVYDVEKLLVDNDNDNVISTLKYGDYLQNYNLKKKVLKFGGSTEGLCDDIYDYEIRRYITKKRDVFTYNTFIQILNRNQPEIFVLDSLEELYDLGFGKPMVVFENGRERGVENFFFCDDPKWHDPYNLNGLM